MDKNYTFRRLFDYCTPDDLKTSARSIIRRKERIPLGIFSYILIITYSLLELLGAYNNVSILIIVMIIGFEFISQTRTGIISLLNIIKIRSLRSKEALNILESFCVYHNRDGNYIKIQDKQMVRIKYHPFNWTVVKIVFKDNNNNKYVFRISLKSVFITIVLSKSRRDNYIENVERKTKIQYQYNLNDLKSIKSAKDFMIFIRDKYRQIRETISC